MPEQPEGRRPEWRPPTKEKLKKSFGRFAIALNDVQFARIMWRRAGESFEQKDVFAAAGFQAAFFASYGRCFSSVDGCNCWLISRASSSGCRGTRAPCSRATGC